MNPLHELIYNLIQKSHKPQSAYKLLDEIKDKVPNAKPMMVYRALSSLEEQGLIHKIKSTSTYYSCKDVIHQGAALFLICKKCGIVKELAIQGAILAELTKLVIQEGFAAGNNIGEIAGECQECCAL